MSYQPPDPPGLPSGRPSPYQPQRPPKKSAIVALILSFFLPGVGHMYVGSVGVGAIVLCVYTFTWFVAFLTFGLGLIFTFGVWVFGLAHSAVLAERRNAEHGYG